MKTNEHGQVFDTEVNVTTVDGQTDSVWVKTKGTRTGADNILKKTTIGVEITLGRSKEVLFWPWATITRYSEVPLPGEDELEDGETDGMPEPVPADVPADLTKAPVPSA